MCLQAPTEVCFKFQTLNGLMHCELQITYTIMFALTNSLTSDALGGSQEMGSVLANDAAFRKEFQQLVSTFPQYSS